MKRLKNEDHPFYCHKKNRLKTACDTPEYLTNQDWSNLKRVIKILQNNDAEALNFFVKNNINAVHFFDRIVGWPEGYIYCFEFSFCEKTGLQAIKKSLPLMLKSLKNRPK